MQALNARNKSAPPPMPEQLKMSPRVLPHIGSFNFKTIIDVSENDLLELNEAKLATEFDSEYDPQRVTHAIRAGQSSGASRIRREGWRRRRYLGCGGFGSVFLEECESVDVEWDNSECEGDGDDDKMIGRLRTVKQLVKPSSEVQTRLCEPFLRELRGLLFFNKPCVRQRLFLQSTSDLGLV